MSIIHNLSEGILLNSEQLSFVDLVTKGDSCCLIGAAGTGKTTAVRAAITSLLQSGRVSKMGETTGN